MTIRTRFAPSPTGYLHVGGARTALFCYLQARAQSGQFILRIEDTDTERSSKESVQVILDGMEWLGLDYDEGPVYQSNSFGRYAEVIAQLLAAGLAYRCDCPRDRLQKLREQQMAAGDKPRYDGHCRNRDDVPEDVPAVVRFRNPQNGDVVFDDQVRGQIRISNEELDDLVIARPDGSPTYNFTVVVDDIDMRISHVIRGDDHINNTPRQINIYHALEAEPPVFAHVPMILGEDGARLSKRHGALSVLEYREAGYLPQALLNYLVRLGWSHGDDEIFSVEEMVDKFDITDVNRKPAAFNLEKLNWLNQHWMRALPGAEVSGHLAHQFESLAIDTEHGPALTELVAVQAERVNTLREMAEQSRVFYQDYDEFDPGAAKKHLRPVAKEALEHLRELLAATSDWREEVLQETVSGVAAALELNMGKVAQPLRVALTGSSVSPAIDKTLQLVGKNRTLQRIDQALEFIRQRQAASRG